MKASKFLAVAAAVGFSTGCAAVQVKELNQSRAGLTRPSDCKIELFIKKLVGAGLTEIHLAAVWRSTSRV